MKTLTIVRVAAMRPIVVMQASYKEVGLTYRIALHALKYWQWYGVVYGRVETVVADRPHTLESGSSILIPPGVERSPCCQGRAPGYFYVVFKNQALHLDDSVCRVLRTPAELRPDMRALVAELKHIPEVDTQAMIEALTVRLLIGLSRQTIQGRRAAPAVLAPLHAGYHEEIVTRVQQFMRQNLHLRFSRRSVAQAVHLSPPHLARVFKAVTDCGMVEYLSALRVERAKELLLESTMSITDIAMEVGYDSFSHFSRVFCSATGVAPSDYRCSGGHVYRTTLCAGPPPA